jgi:hypothetical protein
MRQALAPMLFDDHDRAVDEALRSSPVAKAELSPAAKRKAKKKCTDDGQLVHSFRILLADLATLTRNTVICGKAPAKALLARPTEIQQRAFDPLGIKLHMALVNQGTTNVSQIAQESGLQRMAVTRIKADPAAAEAMLRNWAL